MQTRAMSATGAGLVLVGAMAFGGWGGPGPVGSTDQRAADTVEAAVIREVTTALTAAEMEGRGTGQPGGDRAARYLAERFAAAGLEPAGPNGFLQPVPMARRTIDSASSLTISGQSLRFGEGFLLVPPVRSGAARLKGSAVFLGWGVRSEELRRDDQAGLTLAGRVAFLLNAGRPEGVDPAAWGRASERNAVLSALAERGVIAAVTVAGFGSFEQARNFIGRPTIGLAEPSTEAPPIPLMMVSTVAAERLFAGSGTTFAAAQTAAIRGEMVSRALVAEVEVDIRVRSEPLNGFNVIGLRRGRDRQLQDEAIVYTAHYDAFGGDQAGVVRPGAADNALGVGKLVAIAEGFRPRRSWPRRSLLFFASTGEEHGNLGTEYWLDHPAVPLTRLSANINFDGIGSDVFGRVRRVTDFGISYTDAVSVVEDILRARGIELVPDLAPEQAFYQRSDHYSFAKRGIPPVYLIGGAGTPAASERAGRFLAERYHTPGDTIEADWNWAGARDLAMVGYLLGQRLGDHERMPGWTATSPLARPRGRPR